MSEQPQFLYDGPFDATWTIALAHGAGVPMDAPFMTAFAAGLATTGLRVVRFEFPFMAARRENGSKRPPDREPVLRSAWEGVIETLRDRRLVIGGKSLGGRIASLVADEAKVDGLVCLGYPFHPLGKPDRTRVNHLEHLATPTLVVQGTRDPFGTAEEVSGYALSPAIKVHWLPDGDHDFKPRVKSDRSQSQNWDEGVAAIVEFVGGISQVDGS